MRQQHTIQDLQLKAYRQYLREGERSTATLEKYMRDIASFRRYAAQEGVDKGVVLRYKEYLQQRYKARSVNSMLAALNGFFRFLGWEDCRVRQVKIQESFFCTSTRELNRGEYLRLVQTARDQGKERLFLILQTLGCTGIRVGELHFITWQAVRDGFAEVKSKGKSRMVFLPKKLRKYLIRYGRERGRGQGSIFVTRTGKPVSRSNIWREMKHLCAGAKVLPEKVFPHNLRHLFARTYYRNEKNLSHLADLLGHSSTDTTRIYMVSSGAEHARQLERLNLLL